MKGEGASKGTRYEIVDMELPKGGIRRQPARCTVLPTGHCTLNTNATEMADAIARRLGLDVKAYEFRVGGNTQKGLVALYPVRPGTGKTAPIRRASKTENIITYLAPLFEKVPVLRPVTRKAATVFEDLDENGDACVAVVVGTALLKQKAAGKKDAKTAPVQA